MTKLLILSDSHNSASAVERILHAESDANAVVFLGDGLRDLEDALTLHPKMKVYAVAGNCDFGALEPLDGLAAFDQVVVFYTHGHMYGVNTIWTRWRMPPPPAALRWHCSATPTNPSPSRKTACSCSTRGPAAAATPAPTPTA